MGYVTNDLLLKWRLVNKTMLEKPPLKVNLNLSWHFFERYDGQKVSDNLILHQRKNTCILTYIYLFRFSLESYATTAMAKKSLRNTHIWFALMVLGVFTQLSTWHSEDIKIISNHKHNCLFSFSLPVSTNNQMNYLVKSLQWRRNLSIGCLV